MEEFLINDTVTEDENGHNCKGQLPEDFPYFYGEAINRVYELTDGTLWASNREYSSQVNFCPYCGYKAKIDAVVQREEETS